MDTDVLVIGAGQCGIALSRELSLRGIAHEVVDAHARPGDVWRERWDSLRLFTPARHDALPGRSFPGSPRHLPSASEFADYLDDYAQHVNVPLHPQTIVTRVAAQPAGGFSVTVRGADSADEQSWRARRVVVATGGHDRPVVPEVAAELHPGIVQLHSVAYRRPDDLPGARVLVVGCGASGVQLGVELARAGRRVTVAGKPTPSIPAPIVAVAGSLWFAFLHRVLTRATPLGRKAAPRVIASGAPLVGISARDLDRAGAARGPRLVGAVNGMPQLANGRVIEADAVLWATGYRPSLAWIDGLELDAHGMPQHRRGVSTQLPGLAFLGLPFQFGLTSALIGGAGRDAEALATVLAA